MMRKSIYVVACMALLAGMEAMACTGLLVGKKASTDGSVMISYSADSHALYGELYHWPAASWPKGSMLEVKEWDSGKPLGRIAQVEKTYSVVGNMNEYQVAIAESTLWFGVDDADMAVFNPIYSSSITVPECYRVGNGDMMRFSWTSAFWIHNWVANMAYGKYSFMIQDIRKVQQELEKGYQEMVPAIDKAALDLYAKSPAEAVNFLTWYSTTTADAATARWKRLGEYMIVKYMDGNVKKEENGSFKQNGYGQSVYPDFPGYDEEYYRGIVNSAGERLRVK